MYEYTYIVKTKYIYIYTYVYVDVSSESLSRSSRSSRYAGSLNALVKSEKSMDIPADAPDENKGNYCIYGQMNISI
jgi:hypothetical protein